VCILFVSFVMVAVSSFDATIGGETAASGEALLIMVVN
jgi:hypothetical protein